MNPAPEPTNHSLFRIAGKQPHIVSLMLLSAFAAMGAIIMTPALPTMATFFDVHVGIAQLIVSSFLLGYALGQLIYGPLANRFGRKTALYIGISIATLGTIFSVLSAPTESFPLMVIGRFLEAIGSSSGLAISFTIINDFYYEKEARKILGALMLAFAIVPGIAIAVGGVLVQYIGWRACFYFLLFYGLLLFYLTHRLPETLREKDFNAMQQNYIFDRYKRKFKNKKLLGFAMLAGFSGGCVYVFGAEGPVIGIHLLHTPPALYGVLGLTPYLGTFFGSFIAMRVSELDSARILKFAFLIEFFASILMFVLFILHYVSLWTLLIPMGLFSIGHPILCATAISISIQQDPDKANTTAVGNFAMMSMPVIMTYILSMMHNMMAWVMPVIFIIAMGLMALTYRFACLSQGDK